ncbi:MAG: DedA family protein [Bacteroidia bacterium]|nr:DedA family protein [Bacteroidia bacterium]
MDTIITSISELLIEWGLPGLFMAALLAGSVLPFSSEIVLVAMIKLGLEPVACILTATAGNTVGGMTCYYMGHLGKIEWIERFFKVKKAKIDKMAHFLKGKGSMMAFFTFLPFFGEVIAITLGFMRSNLWLTISSMFIGKMIRYIIMVWILLQTLSIITG